MGGHSTSDDPTKYVPKKLLLEWEKKDPVARFERYLAKKKLWKAPLREKIYAECMDEVGDAVKIAEATPPPALETIFSDVYETVPRHIRRQGQAAFDLAARKGDAAAGGGAFPL
jgi:TPP-dependent pyruvate/acetoin dehydrogenase alpha subunit